MLVMAPAVVKTKVLVPADEAKVIGPVGCAAEIGTPVSPLLPLRVIPTTFVVGGTMIATCAPVGEVIV